MAISNRISNIKPSAAVELDRILSKMRENGESIISLNAGQPDFQTPQNIIEACNKAINDGKTKYTSINGIVELRKAICRKLKNDNGITYSPEEIVVTTGAKQALFNVIQVIINDGDEVIIPSPCWVSYKEMVKLANGVPVTVKTLDDYHLDIDAIKKAISGRTKAIIINTPCNPTGAVYSRQELEALASIAVEKNLYIITDEVYEKIIYDGSEHFSIASVSDEVKAHCITINGFSKAYAMTGWRIGYAAAPLDIAMAVCSLQGHTTSNSTTFVQWAAIEALEGPQTSVEKMKNEFWKRRDFIIDELSKIQGIKCRKPQGAFYVFADVSSFYGKKDKNGTVIKNCEDFCAYILSKAKVAVLPGSAFDDANCVRLSYSNSLENISKAISLVRDVLSELK